MATPRKTHHPDALTMEVVELIGEVVARFYEDYETAAGEHALTGAQARLLSLLSLEPLPMRKLAQKLKCEPSNVTGIVDRLEERGLLVRAVSAVDRRVKMLVLTDAGIRLRQRILADLAEAPEPIARLSADDQRALREILSRALEPTA